MGVIESAIEKLRRSGQVVAPGGVERTSLVEHRSWTAAPPANVSTRIVELDRVRLHDSGYLPESGHEVEFADEFQQVKRRLIRRALAADASADLRLVMVTSALPADGKTFTTLNLALSIARERDVSVLLVDADFPKAHIGRALDVDGEPGLLDAVSNESSDVESFVLRTNVPGLELLPGGRSSLDAAELVSSTRMGTVMTRLLEYNPRRIVLFDAAPVLAAADARALMHVPGQILLVARAGHTPQHALLEAIGQIDKKKLQGLVLNDAYITRKNSYYGGYGYGAGVRSAESQSTD